jgi:hypothetical protein
VTTQSTEVAVPSRFAWSRCLDGFQTVFAAGMLIPCLQGRAGTPKWLLLAIGIPIVRFLLSSTYRRRILAWLSRLWDNLEAYPVEIARLPWLAVLVLVVMPYGFLLLAREYAFQTADTRPAVLTAAELVTHGDSNLTEDAKTYSARRLYADDGELPHFVMSTPTGIHSGYPSGMAPFALPVTAAARLLHADLSDIGVHARLEKWTAAWLAAACVGLFFLITLHLAAPKPALAATFMLAVGSVMFSTVGQALWQHGGVIFWGLLALWLEFRQARLPSRLETAIQGLACAMMIACRLSAALYVVLFVAWVLLRSWRRGFVLVVSAALAFTPWALWYQSIYGTPFGPSTMQLAADNWSARDLSGLAGVVISPSRGVLVYQPWLLLAGLSLVPTIRRRMTESRAPCPAGWAWFCSAVFLAHLALIGAWSCWWGGYGWGSRLAADVVPLGALLCVPPIAVLLRSVTGRCTVLTFAVLAFLLHVPAVYLKQDLWNSFPPIGEQPERLWSWSDAPFFFAESRHQQDLTLNKSPASRERERPE